MKHVFKIDGKGAYKTSEGVAYSVINVQTSDKTPKGSYDSLDKALKAAAIKAKKAPAVAEDQSE